MNFTQHEKIDILRIVIATASLISSFVLSIDYISWIAVILCGIPIFKECVEGLITEFDIKADLLVSMAIIASLIIGETFAAGEIAAIMALGGFLEEYTVSKTQEKLQKLSKMTPQTATRIRNNKEETIPVEEVEIGDILKVVPGESIPTDGVIVNGESSIDQSTITGESLPVDKTQGDEVYSGTINLYGSFTMKTTKASEDSSLQKLIKLAESSAPENAKIVREADKWATMIVAIAFTSAIITYLFTFEIIRAVTILVVFCPCALVLATPTAIMSAIGNLTRYGILVKDGQSLEELAHVSELVFDKTGTLTYGMPKVVNVLSDNPDEMMHLLSSLESKSEHPLAKAIVKYSKNDSPSQVNDFRMHIGMGVSGKISGSNIIAGNRKLLKSQNIRINDNKRSENGEIEIYVAKDSKYMGKVQLRDTLRENSKETVRNIKRLRVKTTLLTGDNDKTARHIANQVKVRNVRSNCLPEDKTEYIKNEQIRGHKVVMIGDGVNDAPSLRKANVGIAMGDIGSDISVEAANIALVNDNIADIPHLIGIARKTIRTIKIAIGFSLILNFVSMGLAMLGIINPVQGALIHNFGSVFVIVYASTLSRYRISEVDYRRAKKLGLTKHLNKTPT